MGQKCKVVPLLEKTPEIAELNRFSHLGYGLLGPSVQFTTLRLKK
jgi:hypothetical protein